MADEQAPDKKEPLLEDDAPSATEQPVEEPAAPAPEVKEELPDITPLETFWSGIDAQTSAKVVAPIDPPEKLGEAASFNGNLVFKDFPSSGHSFSGDAKLIQGLYKDVPNGQLILPIGGILAALASVIKEYTKRGERIGNVIRLAGEAMPTVFGHVFKAIKEQSDKIHWSKGDPKWKSTPLVHYIVDEGLDKDLGVNLIATFEGMKSAINEEAVKILGGGKGDTSRKKAKDPFFADQETVRSFVVNDIPKEMFKQVPAGMFASLRMDEIEGMKNGAKVVASIKAAKEGQGGDIEDFWFKYNPKTDVVIFENKRLSNQMYVDRLRKVYQKYESPNITELYNSIADKYDVSVDAVSDWFKSLLQKLTPDMRKKVEPIVAPKEGLKKLASQQWAGPSLEQVGGLVGDAQAKWASELAGNLAARFDYISFPKLEGGPSEIRKLATLPLSEEQIARVEKYRAKAASIMQELVKNIYDSNASGEEERSGFVSPGKEEVERLAEDVLLELVDQVPSTTPDDEFMKELKSKLYSVLKMVQKHPHSEWPSTKTGPEDVLQDSNVSFDPVSEAPEMAELNKTALLKDDDAVQVVPGNPNVPREFHGKMGKIVDVKADIGICPQHGPEPFIRYLVEFDKGQMGWFRDDEIRTVATTN